MRYLEALKMHFIRKPETTLTILQIAPTITVLTKTSPTETGLLELRVPIIVYLDKDNGYEFKTVNIYCPHRCGVFTKGKSLTSVDIAFHDSAEDMYRHLRHDHQNDILEYHVEISYMPQILSLKAHLHK